MDAGAPDASADDAGTELPTGLQTHWRWVGGPFLEVGSIAWTSTEADQVSMPPFNTGPIDFPFWCDLGPLVFVPQTERGVGADEVDVWSSDISARLGGTSVNETIGLESQRNALGFMNEAAVEDGVLVSVAGPAAVDRGRLQLRDETMVSVAPSHPECDRDDYYVTSVTLGARFVFAVRFTFPNWLPAQEDRPRYLATRAEAFANRRGSRSPIEILETQVLTSVHADLADLEGRIEIHTLQVGGRENNQATLLRSTDCGTNTVKHLEACRELISALRKYGDDFIAGLGDNPTPEDTGGWTTVRARVKQRWW